jgi:hypothetical protein
MFGGDHLKGYLNYNIKERSYIAASLFLLVVLGCAFAEYVSVSTAHPERVISKKFNVGIVLSSEVNDLYSWQAVVTFNPNVVLVLEVENGGILSPNSFTLDRSNLSSDSMQLEPGDSLFIASYDDVELGKLVLAETKIGDVSGTSVSGALVTVTFGVFGHGSYDVQLLDALLYDSNLNLITQLSLTTPAEIS